MPKFYFDVQDGEDCRWDEDGLVLDNVAVARLNAMTLLAEFVRSRMPDGDRRTFRCLLRDSSNRLIYRATLSLDGEWLA